MKASPASRSAFDVKGPRVFSIDAGRPFLSDLADGLIDALGDELPRAEIFLPTRRAVRAAADAFLDAYAQRGREAALLPRFLAIGDIDEEEMVAFASDPQDEIDLAPAISSSDRLIALARLVATRDRLVFAGQQNWPGAIAAARELGKLLDSFYTEEIDPSALRSLDVADSANHWARGLEFLEIVTEEWPKYLREIGREDPARRRANLISALARRWRERPPAHPVVIAGTTASAPSVARLVGAIANAPAGAAILPGLDRSADAGAWEAIEDAHPQSGFKALLKKLDLSRADIRAWPRSGGEAARTRLLAVALRPAEATDEWLALIGVMTRDDENLSAATKGLTLIEAENEEAEASIIAALFRETVEAPERTAILVTPDRHLARRVALKMRRWKISIDDSAGVPFANSACGAFLRLVAIFLEDPGDPVALLALLRHPLARLGLPRRERESAVDMLDRALRGVRPPAGLAGVEKALRDEGRLSAETAALINVLAVAAGDFPNGEDAPFAARLAGHIAAAERLADADRLWAGDDGEKGAALLAEIALSSLDDNEFGGRRYSETFEALIANRATRPRRDAHPRLQILGPLEARLQSADRVILGGLNEGAWPADSGGDPFLSRAMRKQLGLVSPERRIGLSAHDFAGLAAQPEVFLTRAKRDGGKPASPSRWIIRLKNILAGAGAIANVDRSRDWSAAIATLDAPGEVVPARRPRPRAGPGRRPEGLFVTQIEKWLRDPYAIYARHLLKLKRLDAPDDAFGARHMGSLLHAVFAEAAAQARAPSREALRAIFELEALRSGLPVSDRRFWSKAIEEALEWFGEFDAGRRRLGQAVVLEKTAHTDLSVKGRCFTLSANPDRIDLLATGGAAIFDYKTGKIPTGKEDKTFNPQLALTGVIVEDGGFAALGRRAIDLYAYHKVANRNRDDAKNCFMREGAEARAAIAEAREKLIRLIAAFDDPETVYHSQPRPQFTDDYGDYDQLARRKEWGAAHEGGDVGE